MIEIKNLTKAYGDKVIFKDFNLKIEDKKTLAILGGSGIGKTTLLKVMANLTDYHGEVTGIDKVSFVFAEDRLLAHKTVKENLLFVAPNATNIDELLSVSGLYEYKDAYPKTLSTGMARRVAILRAFVYQSDVLFMDEPFRSLDVSLKYKLMEFFKTLIVKDKKTTVFVTHDPDEAVTLADRIIIISDGGNIVYDEEVLDKDVAFKKIKEELIK